MHILKQVVIPDIDVKVLFIETAKRHFHVVAMDTDHQFYSIAGKNIRWVVGSFADTEKCYGWRHYAAKKLYRETVKDFRKDARARARKARQLSVAA